MNDFKNFKQIINSKRKKLQDNESFCMAPWIHLNVSPNGDVPICCNIINNKNTIAGNVNDSSLEEIWNSEVMKAIRTKMLNGEKIKECSSCYDREKISKYTSMRTSFNYKYFNKHKNLVRETKIDGSIDDLNIIYFDFRFSNKCNFTCRTCVPHYSSSWEKKLGINNPKIKDTKKIIDETKKLILENKLEEIYFAGGEPLITDEHWEIINFLIEQKCDDIYLRYNTNLSVLNYKGNNFIEKLKNFKNVVVSPSCDSLGIRGEYIRTGFSSKRFIDNINLLKQNNFNYHITTVLSFFNIMYLYDFFEDLKNNDIKYNNLFFIVLMSTEYSIYNLPNNVLNRSLEGIDKLIKSDFMSIDKKKYLKNLADSLRNNNNFNINKFKKRISTIKKQDSLNKLQFQDCFPELYEICSEYFK